MIGRGLSDVNVYLIMMAIPPTPSRNGVYGYYLKEVYVGSSPRRTRSQDPRGIPLDGYQGLCGSESPYYGYVLSDTSAGNWVTVVLMEVETRLTIE